MWKSSGAGEENGDGLVSSSDDRRASSDGTAVEKARRLSSSIHCEEGERASRAAAEAMPSRSGAQAGERPISWDFANLREGGVFARTVTLASAPNGAAGRGEQAGLPPLVIGSLPTRAREAAVGCIKRGVVDIGIARFGEMPMNGFSWRCALREGGVLRRSAILKLRFEFLEKHARGITASRLAQMKWA
jgi:hypothetical protein